MKRTIIVIIFIILNLIFINCCYVVSADADLDIDAESAYLVELESGNTLYSKNSDEKLYPASTTKIMTAIIIIENCDLDEMATVSQNAIDLVPSGYTNAGLVPGEVLSVNDLLNALLIASANEAANVLAEHLSGSISNFADLMNEKAEAIGCTSTHFTNANGMHDENHYTTAKDLSLIASYCIKNDTFKDLIGVKNYTLPATSVYPASDRVLYNTNYLIYDNSKYSYSYAIGGKTGYTEEAGYCLVAFSEKDGTTLCSVILDAPSTQSRFTSAIYLFNYGYDNYSNRIIASKGSTVTNVTVSGATSETKNVDLITYETLQDYLPNDLDLTDITYNVDLNDDLKAPIYASEKVGTVTYTLNSKTYTVPIVAKTSAYKSQNYSGYLLALGLILFIAAVMLIRPKSKSKSKIRKRSGR